MSTWRAVTEERIAPDHPLYRAPLRPTGNSVPSKGVPTSPLPVVPQAREYALKDLPEKIKMPHK